MKDIEIEWNLVLILIIASVLAVVLTMVTADGIRQETNRYLGYCVAEGHAESYCMMRWIELKKVNACNYYEEATVRHRY